jgi:signal transduction histidine kinase
MSIAQPTSIATKLTRMNMLVSTLALLLTCAGFVGYDLVAYRQTIVANISSQAQVAGSGVVSALTFDDPNTATRTLAALKAAPNIVAARVYTADGEPFASYQRDAASTLPAIPPMGDADEETHSFTHTSVRLTRAILFENRLVGFVFIESDLHTLYNRLRSYAVIAAIMVALSMLVALSISRLARRGIARPIVHLAEVAGIVSRGENYSLRARPTGGEAAELGLLVSTFNDMLDQIEARDHKLKAAHDELEMHVEERTAQLAAANKELESFSYSVSHDLRAPLRSIDGFSLALEEDFGDKIDELGKSHIRRVRAATQRMGLLIDDLLNLSRLSRAEMHRERVDLTAMGRAIVAELLRTDEPRKVEWLIQDGMITYADTRLLRVVLDNLLGNSWKYTSRHPTARIELGMLPDGGGNPTFFVKDDGAGFDAAYSDKLFGAFQRLHGMNEFAGTGVGLATVARILRRHGGSVWAEGAVEKGATFYFTVGKFIGENNNGQSPDSADRRQSGRRSADPACVAKE